jgi:SOS-response transcriptional repressor LexA
MDLQEIHLRNLETLIAEVGTKKALAKRANASYNFICQVHSAKRIAKGDARGLRRLGPEVCRKLELAQGKPFGWMDQVHDEPVGGVRAVPSRSVPILSWAECARVKLMDARELLEKEATIYVGNHIIGRLFSLIVRGDSMVDPSGPVSFPDGSKLVVNADANAQPGDFVIVQMPNAPEAVFKQLVHDGLHPYLKPLNPRYPLAHMPEGGEIVGVVISVQIDIPTRLLR